MNSLISAMLKPLLSLAFFILGFQAHPLFLFIAFIPLLDGLFPAERGFNRLSETLTSIVPSLLVVLFLGVFSVYLIGGNGLQLLLFVILFSLALWLSHVAWRLGKSTSGYFGFIFFWLAMEYLMLSYLPEMSLPSLGAWLTRGVDWTGWYALTGALGGSLWVLLINLIGLVALRREDQLQVNTPRIFYLVLAIFLIALPIYIHFQYWADLSNPFQENAPWVAIAQEVNGEPSAFVQRGEYLGLIAFWMGIFLAISVFVKQKTRIKISGKSKRH
jgi:hypothetical protein